MPIRSQQPEPVKRRALLDGANQLGVLVVLRPFEEPFAQRGFDFFLYQLHLSLLISLTEDHEQAAIKIAAFAICLAHVGTVLAALNAW